MPENSSTSRQASCTCPPVIARETIDERQPEVAIKPSLRSRNRSRSIRGL
jgi:hypothetical protein